MTSTSASSSGQWRMPVHVALALALLGALAAPPPAAAQVLYGSIVGHVNDSTGAVVPGATVTITNAERQFTRETLTDGTGTYTFPAIQTGTYTVVVTLQGFRTATQQDVIVTLNNVTRVDIAMQLGQLAETIHVTGESPLIQTDRAEVRAELKAVELVNLPVSIGVRLAF